MHDGRAAIGRAPDRGGIPQIITVRAVKAGDIVAEAFQVSRYRGTDLTAVPRDQNAHGSMIAAGRQPC